MTHPTDVKEQPVDHREEGPENDILVGAAAIAAVVFKDPKQRRKIYYRVERGELPHFYLGGTICSTRSALSRMAQRHMREAVRDLEAD